MLIQESGAKGDRRGAAPPTPAGLPPEVAEQYASDLETAPDPQALHDVYSGLAQEAQQRAACDSPTCEASRYMFGYLFGAPDPYGSS